MAEKIFVVEHKPGEELVLRIKPPKSWLPESTRAHFLAAHKEGLLALRSIIDAAAESIEKAEKSKETYRSKIEVE